MRSIDSKLDWNVNFILEKKVKRVMGKKVLFNTKLLLLIWKFYFQTHVVLTKLTFRNDIEKYKS